MVGKAFDLHAVAACFSENTADVFHADDFTDILQIGKRSVFHDTDNAARRAVIRIAFARYIKAIFTIDNASVFHYRGKPAYRAIFARYAAA